MQINPLPQGSLMTQRQANAGVQQLEQQRQTAGQRIDVAGSFGVQAAEAQDLQTSQRINALGEVPVDATLQIGARSGTGDRSAVPETPSSPAEARQLARDLADRVQDQSTQAVQAQANQNPRNVLALLR